MFAYVGHIGGYNGSFLFDSIGDKYEKHPDVPYILMRLMPALLGSLVAPLIFLILYETNHTLPAILIGTAMALFDNAQVTQSRLILLDSPLIFFGVLSVWSWIKFYRQRSRPFTFAWWAWLVFTGITISLTTSVKLVGLFMVALVGMGTIQDLWRLIDVRRAIPDREIARHFLARVFGLIFVPTVVYLIWFAVHFKLLYKTGPGDIFMSPAFQANLEGSPIYYGANVTFLNLMSNAWLHSHPQKYPLRYEDGRVSSQGQQVTGYTHVDSNNNWMILPEDGIMKNQDGSPRYVKKNDVVRLIHANTGLALLTHDVASPLTTTNQEFTCIDPSNSERFNETLFRIEPKSNTEEGEYVTTLLVEFRMVHIPTKVNMNVHPNEKLPDWGFGQLEVNGNKSPRDKKNFWVIDVMLSPQLPNDPELNKKPVKDRISPGFFSKFVELQMAMLGHNAALTSSHPFQSSPYSWPVLSRGISFWTRNKTEQIYLLGNPLTWWTGAFVIALHLFFVAFDIIAARRGINDFDAMTRRHLLLTGGFFTLGYFLHWFPFLMMGRALFLHHYLPATLFAYMVTANVFDMATRWESARVQWTVVAVLTGVFATTFLFFAPLTYGLAMDGSSVKARQWIASWDLSFSE